MQPRLPITALCIGTLLGLTVLHTPARAATIAYWNIPEADDRTLTDLAGGDQTLVGASAPMNQSGLNIAPFPVPNPDPITTGHNGSIYCNGGGEVPHLQGAGASVFQMTNASSFTMEGWIQAAPDATGYIASDRHQGNSWRGWFIELQGSGGIQFYSNSGGIANSITSPAIDDGTAHHFAAVWDHTMSEMGLFIDGSIVGAPVSHTVGAYGTYGFSIGGRDGTSVGGGFVDNRLTAGTRLDELRFSDEALAPWQFLSGSGIDPAIPEPATVVLLALGAVTLGLRRLGRRGGQVVA